MLGCSCSVVCYTNRTAKLYEVTSISISVLILTLVSLPVRRYASAGNRDRNVSVRLSRAGIVSKRKKSQFLHHLVMMMMMTIKN